MTSSPLCAESPAMRDEGDTTEGRLLEQHRRLVKCCDRFEMACTAGLAPRVDDFQDEVPSTEWPAVREELELLRKTYETADTSEATRQDPARSLPEAGDHTDTWAGGNLSDIRVQFRDRVSDVGQLPVGTKIGNYEIISKVGSGGMGVVFRARQLTAKIDRQVALKLIRKDHGTPWLDDIIDEARQRFANETLATGRLAHENIVSVFEVGEWQGRPFYTMSLVEGKGLSVVLRSGPFSNEKAAKTLEPVARAVAHAHACQIIHRDIKPSNILLDVNERPYVTDFGLAKLLEQNEPLTMPHQILGTVSYMSPEQATDPTSVRAAADIYSLGATLYEMLTGRPPFRAADPAETMRQVKLELPVPPRRLNPAISRDLETICLKCLEKEPDRRYITATELADELARVLKNEPIRARPISPFGRTLRWVGRNPGIAALLVAIVMVALTGFLSTVFQLRRTELALAELEKRSYFDQIDLAAELFAANKFAVADAQLAGTNPSLRGWEFQYLNRLVSSKKAPSRALVQSFPPQPGGLYALAFHPDGKWFATGGRLAGVRIWDPHLATPFADLPEIPAGSYIDDIKWIKGPTCNHLAAGTRDGKIHLWDESDGKFSGYRSAKIHAGAVTFLSFDPTGTHLASASETGLVSVIDVATMKQQQTIRKPGPAVRAIAFHPDGKRLVIAGDDQDVSLWDASAGGRLFQVGKLGESIGAVAFSNDGRYLTAGDSAGTIRIWDLAGRTAPLTLPMHLDAVNSLAFTPDGTRLASAGVDGLIKIWDFAEGRNVLKLSGHTGQVDAICFRSDGLQLISVDVDGGIRIWDASAWGSPPPPAPISLSGHKMLIVNVAVSPDGERMASAGSEGDILAWKVLSTEPPVRLVGHEGRVNGLSIDSTGRWLSSAGRDESLRIWDLSTGKQASCTFASKGDRLTSVAFRPREHQVAFVGTKGKLLLWDCVEGHEPIEIGEHPDEAYAVAFHPDGQRIATAGASGKIRLWDISRSGMIDEFREHTKPIDSLAFSPDGTLLASASHDKTVCLRDLARGTSRELGKHNSHIWRVAFSSDGRMLASAGGDGYVKVWDIAGNGREVVSLENASRVFAVVFDPKNRYLASAGGDRVIKLWDPKAWDFPR